jgi:hypothetical protein
MNLHRLIYLSEATKSIGPSELRTLVGQSAANNESKGISGLLLYSGRYFLQVLEGDPLRVSSLYAHICRDPRHGNAKTLQCATTSQRLFPDWGMELVTSDQSTVLDQAGIDRTLLRLRLSQDGDASAALILLEAFRRQLKQAAA